MTFQANFSGLFRTENAEAFREHLLEHYLPFDGLRTNLVIGPAGEAVDEAGSSRGLSSPEDHQLLLALREISDVVIVSARTALAEQYSASKRIRMAIIQGSQPLGEIPALKRAREDALPVLLISHITQLEQNQHLLANPNVQLIGIDSGRPGRLTLEEIISQLQTLGLKRQLLEAGVTMASQFLGQKLIGRFCLSTVSDSKLDFELHSKYLTDMGSTEHRRRISWRSSDGIFTEWECVR